MLRLIAAAVALVLAAAAPLPEGPETGYPGPESAPAAMAASSPPVVRECVQTFDAPGGVETCAAWAVWGDAPMPTPAPWPQAYP